METIINAWLSIWLYVMAAIGIILGYQLYKNRQTWDKINILCTIAVTVRIV